MKNIQEVSNKLTESYEHLTHFLEELNALIIANNSNMKSYNYIKNAKEPQHNLPRTDTISPQNGARWLREKYKELKKEGISPKDFCFIMHRFIPATASAWAYCEPGGNTVQIDCLWGLPDGLQFCPHDTFEVDLRINKVPGKKNRFKPYFLREQSDGSWEYVPVNRKFARHSSLSTKAQLLVILQDNKLTEFQK